MIRAGDRNAVVYLVYPRSFADSNGDGIGDLDGITRHLDHIASLGADAIWVAPMFASPQVDMGYDVSDYCAIAPEYGDLAAMDRLIARAHELGLGVLLDIVPCHSSIEHPWFRDHPEWYIIRDTPERPNNWLSKFGGPAWDRDPHGRGWYLHSFYPEQPNLNWRNPDLVEAMHGVFRFWFDRGVDGFRIDAITMLFVDEQLRDEPAASAPFPVWERPEYDVLDHIHTTHQPEIFDALAGLRAAFPEKYFVSEAYRPIEELSHYLQTMDSTFCFELQQSGADAADLAAIIRDSAHLDGMGWMLANHDFPRLATRWGDHRARMAALLLLTLPGTVFLYQGDEIGMPDGPGCDPPIDRVGRDGFRHPMQWTREGSFTTGTPWLPMVNPAECNVADQSADERSMLSLYRKLIAARRELGGLATDVCAEGSVITFRRGGHTVEINLGENPHPRRNPAPIVLATDDINDPAILPGHTGVLSRS